MGLRIARKPFPGFHPGLRSYAPAGALGSEQEVVTQNPAGYRANGHPDESTLETGIIASAAVAVDCRAEITADEKTTGRTDDRAEDLTLDRALLWGRSGSR